MQALPTPLKNFRKNQIIIQIRSKWLNFKTLYTVMLSVIKVSDGGIYQFIFVTDLNSIIKEKETD